MSSTEKKEGATQICSGCQTPLTCREITKEWNGKAEKKLQWQDTINKKPHFKKNMGTGKYDCINIPKKDDSKSDDDYLKKKQKELQETRKRTSTFSEEQLVKIDKEITTLQLIETIVINKLPAETNPQKIGLYIKLVRNSLEKR